MSIITVTFTIVAVIIILALPRYQKVPATIEEFSSYGRFIAPAIPS